MNHVFAGYEEYKGEIPGRTRAAWLLLKPAKPLPMVSATLRSAAPCSLFLQKRFTKASWLAKTAVKTTWTLTPARRNHVSNMRASGSDDAIRLIPPQTFSLEQALEHINDDELVEVTPKSIRMRKKVLDRLERGKMRGRMKNVQA